MELAGDVEKKRIFQAERTAFQKNQKLEKGMIVEKLVITSINN